MNEVVAKIDILGRGTVSVNGEDMSHIVDGLQIMTAAGQPTQLFLALKAGCRWEGQAEVTIVDSQAGADAGRVVQFLQGLSSAEVEREALDALAWGEDEPMSRRILHIIQDKVEQYANELGGGSPNPRE